MKNMNNKVILTRERIDISDVLNRVSKSEECGAVVMFIGTVRGLEGGEKVHELNIEIDMDVALETLQKLRQDTIKEYGIQDLVVVHRYGTLMVGDTIVVIVVASAHRKESFDACEYFIDELKRIVPIWKLEKRENGMHWVGSEWLK